MKIQSSEWEKIIANEESDQRLISKVYKQLIQVNIRKTSNLIKKKWAEDLNRHFSKEDINTWPIHIWKDAQHCSLLEKCKSKLQWCITSHNQNGHHKKKNANSKCWRGCGEKGTLLYCWWEWKLTQSLWKTVWRFLNKLGIKLPDDPAIPFLGIHPENATIQKHTCTIMFTAVLFTTARISKKPRCPSTDE